MPDSRFSLTGKTAVDGAAEAMRPHTYTYKRSEYEPRSQPNGGIYAGIYAQELDRNPITRQAVQHTPGGLRIELGPQVSTLSAIAGRHAQRIGGLEHHLTGLLHAHRSLHKQLSEHDQMLQKLHEILSRKLG